MPAVASTRKVISQGKLRSHESNTAFSEKALCTLWKMGILEICLDLSWNHPGKYICHISVVLYSLNILPLSTLIYWIFTGNSELALQILTFIVFACRLPACGVHHAESVFTVESCNIFSVTGHLCYQYIVDSATLLRVMVSMRSSIR